jgi:hypothetical protein
LAILPYSEIKPRIEPIRQIVTRFELKMMDELNSIKQNFRKLGSQANEYKNAEWTLKRKRRLWISFCDHYSLAPQLREFSLSFAYENFHSFRYWVDYRLTYENKLIFENKKSVSGDYLDWEQTVYLNIMDYLVTEDKKLKAILKGCDNEEMHHVAISFNEFIECLKSGLLPKRAPDTTSEVWHDAR